MQQNIKDLLAKLDKLLQGNPNDILNVANPDIGCEDVDSTEGWAHADYFQVNWDKRPHRIAPGQTRRFPRWLALHYAKHLADHILMKEQDKTGKLGLLNHPVRRPEVLSTILLSIDEYFEEPPLETEGMKAEKKVEELNTPVIPPNEFSSNFGGGKSMELHETNLGAIPPPALGKLAPAVATPPPPVESKTSIYDPEKPLPTHAELLDECNKLGIELQPKKYYKVEELIELLKKF